MFFLPQQKWRRALMVYRIAGSLPFGGALMDAVRLLTGTSRQQSGHIGMIREMLQMLHAAGKSVEGKKILEVGVGWRPVLPALFYGMGARYIIMIDIARHMRKSLVAETVRYLLDHAAEIANLTALSQDYLESRWRKMLPGSWGWVRQWRDMGITYKAPFDFGASDLPGASLDMIYSNSCLNYVPVVQLRKIFRESYRLLDRPGWIAHNIHVYDDLAGKDPDITQWNFLRFSEEEWSRTGNCRLHYQNRLRPRSYEALARENGFRLAYGEILPTGLTEANLDRTGLNDEFKELPVEQLLCSHFLLVAEKQ